MKGPLVAYLPWHLRDALGRALTPVAIFLAMGVLPLWTLAGSQGLAALRPGGAAAQTALQVYASMLTLATTLGAMVAVSGIVALDRERQYFRFLFSHPVVPWAYYAQRVAVGAALFVLATMLIALGYRLVVAPVPVLGAGAAALVAVALYGSLAMLCGALLNRDGVAFIAVVIVGNVIQDMPEAVKPAWLDAIGDALPPFHASGEVRTALLRELPVDRGDLLHVALYAVAMLVAALLIVRRAPLAR